MSVSPPREYEEVVVQVNKKHNRHTALQNSNDVKRLKLAQLPYIPERRGSDMQAVRISDDLFTVFTCLDEHMKLKDLPRYVVDSPDSMPSVRLYDGDSAEQSFLCAQIWWRVR